MTVYVVYLDYDHEGCGYPLAAFSSMVGAEEYIKANRRHEYECWGIEPLTLDEEA